MALILDESRRLQLDNIVQKMIKNKETDGNIQFVVDDFKQKYGVEEPIDQPRGLATGIPVGFGKGLLETVRGASSLGERGIVAGLKTILPKKAEEFIGLKDDFQTGAEKIIPEKAIKAEGLGEKIGKGLEVIAEFLAPSAKIAKISKGKSLLKRAGIEGGLVGSQTAVKRGEIDSDAKTAAIVGAMFPVAGAGIMTFKKVLKPLGQKVQQTVVRPSQKDFKEGFKIDNITKYKLGGSLEETATKAHIRMNQLTEELRKKLEGSTNVVNLNKVAERTAEVLMKGKGREFGNIKATQRVLDSLKEEITEVAGRNGLVDLIEATNVKRGAGTKGAWAFGRIEPDAGAVETVYSKFYSQLRKEIEKQAPDGVQEINKKIGEIIPISNAVLRRLPVAQRNNIISLTDSIGLFSSMFNPKALALIGANRLSKSGKFGDFLIQVAEKQFPLGAVGKRFFGQ